MKTTRIHTCLSLFLLGMGFFHTAHAKTRKEQSLVDHSILTVQDVFDNVSSSNPIYGRLKRARAIMICPSITQISLVFGGSGGDCVLLSRDARNSWSSPAFYKMSSGSFGIQLGVQTEKVVLFIMNEHSLRGLLDSQFTMGATASATAANSNGHASEDTADIYTVQKASGLYAGASLKGSKLKINSAANHNYYNEIVGPEDIVMAMRVNNSGANPLRKTLMKYSGRRQIVASNPPPAPTDNEDQDTDTIDLTPQQHNHSIKSENLDAPH